MGKAVLCPINKPPDTGRRGQTRRSLWAATGEPAVQDPCAHFGGKDTQAQGAADVPEVTPQVSGEDSVACGLAQDGRGEESGVRADTLG